MFPSQCVSKSGPRRIMIQYPWEHYCVKHLPCSPFVKHIILNRQEFRQHPSWERSQRSSLQFSWHMQNLNYSSRIFRNILIRPAIFCVWVGSLNEWRECVLLLFPQLILFWSRDWDLICKILLAIMQTRTMGESSESGGGWDRMWTLHGCMR